MLCIIYVKMLRYTNSLTNDRSLWIYGGVGKHRRYTKFCFQSSQEISLKFHTFISRVGK